METRLSPILNECLEALAQGESLESILARYPDDAGQLHSHLILVSRIRAVQLKRSPHAQENSRQRFLATAAQLRDIQANRRRFVLGFSLLQGMAGILLLLGLGGLFAIAASAGAVPGDTLYGTKRIVEDVRLLLAAPDQVEQIDSQLEQRRIEEIKQLLAAGRSSEVVFAGVIESIEPDVWLVSGLQMVITPETSFDFTPLVGLRVTVAGYTRNGSLYGAMIIIDPEYETPEALPTATPLIEPSRTAAPRISPEQPPATQDPESDSPVVPMETPTPPPPLPTATVFVPSSTPAPTLEPTQDAGGSDDGSSDDDGHDDEEDESEDD